MPHALVAPAVDVDRFRPGPPRDRVPGDPFHVLSVARLHWKKGLEHGLDAVRRLACAGVDVHHRIVGAGPHEDAVRACVDDLGLNERVTLLGERSRDEVRDELARADAFLHPAVSEGFCNAVLEAQAMEVPVVVTDADGLPENVADGRTGFVVPRRDGRALAEALAAIEGDPALARRLGAAGRSRVRERFGRDGQLDAFVAFYEALAAGRPERLTSTRCGLAPASG